MATQTECLYGGAAGGGKTDAMLMAALQFVHVPGYSAIIFRRTFPQLRASDGMIRRSRSWIGKKADWNKGESVWTFPTGRGPALAWKNPAYLAFGHIQHEDDVENHQGAAYHFIGFEELTQFMLSQYRYLFSRNRRPTAGPLSKVPMRFRATANPGGIGHEWVAERWGLTSIPPKPPNGRIFIPARLEDNPHIDQEDYEKKLAELDPITYKQLRDGDWRLRHSGNVFKREWFTILDFEELPSDVRALAMGGGRYWDFAATAPKTTKTGKRAKHQPDYTAGPKGLLVDENLYILDVSRGQWPPEEVETQVVQAAEEDGRRVMIWLEEEPGASGKAVTSHYQRNKALRRYTVTGDRPSGPKRERWKPLVAKAAPKNGRAKGKVFLVRGPWNKAFLDEVATVTWEVNEAIKDDQVDATAGLLDKLSSGDASWLRSMMKNR